MRLRALFLLCLCYIEVSAQSNLKGKIADTAKPKIDSLPAAIVNPSRPFVRLKGDTLEYSTAGIKLKTNATVEDLLRRLPGVQVNPDGTIMVNGQKIERLLIDGEEIFGRDLTTITKNFNADLFSKVQLLDKKSDQSTFTGIDDGARTKTLNLVVKEDRKGGYFGQLEGGAGTGGYYDNKGLIGTFKEKRQLAAIGLASNTGTTGFTGSGSDGSEAVGLSLDAGIDDGLAASAGTGVPQSQGTGVHFSNQFNNGDDHATGNYSYGHLLSQPRTSSVSEQLLPDTLYVQNQTNRSVNTSNDHGFTGSYDLTPDSLSAIRVTLNAHALSSNNQFFGSTSTFLNGLLADKASRTVTSNVTNASFAGRVYWRRKLSSKGRTLSFIADFGTGDNNSSGYVTSNEYFSKSTDTLDQRKVFASTSHSLGGMLNYTEPITTVSTIAIQYATSASLGKTLLNTYNDVNGKYTSLVDSLCANFHPAIVTQTGTVNIQTRTNKYMIVGGLDANWSSLHETNLLSTGGLEHSYLLVSPRVLGEYKFNDTHILYFTYVSNTQLPAFSQLQPIQNNTDPLHINQGNPQLQPMNSHKLTLRYFRVRPSIINIGAEANLIANDISSRTSTDSLGNQLIEPVNTNGSWNIYSYLSLNRKLPSSSLEFSFDLGVNYGRRNNYVNTLLCQNEVFQTDMRIGLNRVIAEKYQIALSSDLIYDNIQSSINTTITPAYWTQIHTFRINLQLPGRLEWNSDMNLTILQKTPTFTGSNKTMIWDCYLNKDIFASRLSIMLRGSNLLGQRTSINRTMFGNQITQNSTNNVGGRYLLVSVVYHFTKSKSR